MTCSRDEVKIFVRVHIAISCVLLFCHASPAVASEKLQADIQRDVMRVVLRDFHSRRLDLLPKSSGVLLIQPESSALGGSEPRSFLRPSSELTCKLSDALRNRLLDNNRERVFAAQLVAPSKDWRLVDERDKQSGIEENWFSGTARGERVKTMMSIWRSAISKDTKRAFVYFSFLWSIHGADAHYLLERKGQQWKVRCTQFFYYP